MITLWVWHKNGRCLPPSTYITREVSKGGSWAAMGGSRLLAMEVVNSFQLSAIVTKSFILDFSKGLGLAN